jgi:gas vesicle protein
VFNAERQVDGKSLKEPMMMRKSWPEITSAFAIGLGVGAIVGMMWAPQSGEETRAMLREKAQDSMDEAVAQGKKVAKKAQRATDSAREFVNDAVDAGQSAYREARNS